MSETCEPRRKLQCNHDEDGSYFVCSSCLDSWNASITALEQRVRELEQMALSKKVADKELVETFAARQLETIRQIEAQRDQLVGALERSNLALEDWLILHLDAKGQMECDPVARTKSRIRNYTDLPAYIGSIRRQIKKALANVGGGTT